MWARKEKFIQNRKKGILLGRFLGRLGKQRSQGSPSSPQSGASPQGEANEDGSGFETYATDSPSDRAIKKSEVNLWFTC